MRTYNVRLQADVSKSYRCKRAADSVDLDVEKKSVHELSVNVDLDTPFTVGMIVGSSGSGKTTLAKQIFGDNCFETSINEDKSILDQLPKNLSYEECAKLLSGIGLNSVPCWVRPIKTLSNGQRARAHAVLCMVKEQPIVAIDEWTSVVDRTAAKVMSHCLNKFARAKKKQVIVLSCHYDVIEWLDPDWILDCNTQTFTDRRLLRLEERKRKEQLTFTIREIGRESWRYFSKYHYLTNKLPGGLIKLFGLFQGENQIGFQCFANYVPNRREKKIIMHSNRTVVHPDYQGFGLGIKIINETSAIMKSQGYKVMAKYSSTPVYLSMIKNPEWKLRKKNLDIGGIVVGGSMNIKTGFRLNVKTYSFEYVGHKNAD